MPLDNLFAIDAYADLSIFVIGVSTGAVVVELFLTYASSISFTFPGKLVLSFVVLYSACPST